MAPQSENGPGRVDAAARTFVTTSHVDRVTGDSWTEVLLVAKPAAAEGDIDLDEVAKAAAPSGQPRIADPAIGLAALFAQFKDKKKKIDVLTLVGHSAPGMFHFGVQWDNTTDFKKLFLALGQHGDLFNKNGELRLIGCRLAASPIGPHADEKEDGALLIRRIAHAAGVRVLAPTCAVDNTFFTHYGVANGALDRIYRANPDGSDGTWLVRTHKT